MTRGIVRQEWTDELDAEIQRVYASRQRGKITQLAHRYQIPISTLSTRARRKLRIAAIQESPRPYQWSALENQLLAQYRHLNDQGISQLIERRCGIRRSSKAVEIQRLALGITHKADGADFYSPELIANGLGVNINTVYRWIRRGWLGHFRSGDLCILIKHDALRKFLIHYTAHWDAAKADKWFLVDILSNHSHIKAPGHD